MAAILRMTDLDLTGKRVMIREDLNVPVHDGVVTSDARIRAALPTLKLALEQRASVMIMSHLGRPKEGEVDAALSLEPALLAIAMFFWTPPHFWSLALYNRSDYVGAGVPMLPAVTSPQTTAWVILAHTVVLVTLTLVPAFTGLGPVYGVCAGVGGAYFLYRSILLARNPTRDMALANFRASLVQLSLLLVGAIADGALSGRLIA